jgi:hypothetical protein
VEEEKRGLADFGIGIFVGRLTPKIKKQARRTEGAVACFSSYRYETSLCLVMIRAVVAAVIVGVIVVIVVVLRVL